MGKIFTWLSGKKTIITAILAACCNIARQQGLPIPPGTEEVLYSLALVFLRLGVAKNSDKPGTKFISNITREHK